MAQIWVLNELLCWDENQTWRFLYCSFINLNFKFNTHLQGEGEKAEEAENATDSTLRYLKFNFKQSLKSWREVRLGPRDPQIMIYVLTTWQVDWYEYLQPVADIQLNRKIVMERLPSLIIQPRYLDLTYVDYYFGMLKR